MPRRAVVPALLNAAERLIESRGVHGAGIDAILAEAGRSSRSLYQHFGSKEALAVAALKRRDAAWLAWLKDATAAAPDAEQRLLAIFDALDSWFRQPDFRGSVFVTVAGEVPDHDHPLRQAAAAHMRAVLAFIAETTEATGVVAHARLARELFLLVEGAIATALVLSRPDAAGTARRAAATLIAAHRRDYASSHASATARPG